MVTAEIVASRTRLRQFSPEDRAVWWKMLSFNPTSRQLEILNDDHLECLVSGGFRGGKSYVGSMAATLLTHAFITEYGTKAGGHVAWLVGEDYDRVAGEFNAPEGSLGVWLSALYPGTIISKQFNPGTITIPILGSLRPFIIRTKSASDPMSLGMEGPIWILACEAAHLSQDVHLRLRSRVSEARSKFPGYGLLFLEGTMEGSLGWYAAQYTKYQTQSIQRRENVRSFNLPSESNTHIYPLGADDRGIIELKASLPEDTFNERHMGLPVAPSTRVHRIFDPSSHIGDYPYNPDLPVHLGIDPGYSGQPSHYAVEVAQKQENGQWWVVDEIYEHHLSPDQICDLAAQRPWWKNKEKIAVIDVAGIAHAGAQEPNAEVWSKKLRIRLLHEKVNIRPGIRRFDMMLTNDPVTRSPNLVFDSKCSGVISELGGVPHPCSQQSGCIYSGQTRVYKNYVGRDGMVAGSVPKDEACDGIKALTYMFVSVIGYAKSDEEVRPPRRFTRHYDANYAKVAR